MTKPLIRRLPGGVWVCDLPGAAHVNIAVVGMGSNPRAAYTDWKSRSEYCNHAAHRAYGPRTCPDCSEPESQIA